ncbi:unnamed protein product [Ambrosiozyma monospora]|uniref:Unnamed protein product n=1 Tax=Ambrosiozyma monospora TaxID=43982 RepID=A0ACB5STS2_AMBMO|nr:unnamed protein product [Ambrosiozyma monospora]
MTGYHSSLPPLPSNNKRQIDPNQYQYQSPPQAQQQYQYQGAQNGYGAPPPQYGGYGQQQQYGQPPPQQQYNQQQQQQQYQGGMPPPRHETTLMPAPREEYAKLLPYTYLTLNILQNPELFKEYLVSIGKKKRPLFGSASKQEKQLVSQFSSRLVAEPGSRMKRKRILVL